jgi:chemotaxis receptor (MCP) glutamine deamidase CheD
VAGKDVGGQTGRKLLFNTSTGKVLMKRLNKQVDDIRI